MKLSPFPGVSLDVFNNKHFSLILVSYREEGGGMERGMERGLVEGKVVFAYITY